MSELHALSWNGVRFVGQGHTLKMELGFFPGFRAKNQPADVQSSPLVIPALSQIVSSNEPDASLCPVRAIKWYRQKTLDPAIRAGRLRLFVPYRRTRLRREVSKASVSRWITSAIKCSYEAADTATELRTAANARAHETRALSASWADFNKVSSDQILAAAFWRSHLTFSSHYLRDMTSHADGIYALGPIVASQTVVDRPME